MKLSSLSAAAALAAACACFVVPAATASTPISIPGSIEVRAHAEAGATVVDQVGNGTGIASAEVYAPPDSAQVYVNEPLANYSFARIGMSTGGTGDAWGVIDDTITLSAPTTVLVDGYAYGGRRSSFDVGAGTGCGGAGAATAGGYHHYGGNDGEFSVPVVLPAGTSPVNAVLKGPGGGNLDVSIEIPAGVTATSGSGHLSIKTRRGAISNTRAGTMVGVAVHDPCTPKSGRLTFDTVSAAGLTTMSTPAPPPPPPLAFPVAADGYYDLGTTATFTGTVQVCLFVGLGPGPSHLLHYESGTWVDITSAPPAGGEVCGAVTSLGSFALADPGAPAAPPTVRCAPPDNAWHNDNVSLACTAADTGSGLSNPADASFVLSTHVGPGAETANAVTDSHQVCNLAGLCTTAGPIGGIHVDRKAPTLTLPGSLTVAPLTPAGVAVTYTVTATDGTDPSPAVVCTPPSGSIFPPASTTRVDCTATDHAGNATAGSFTVTVTSIQAVVQAKITTIVAALSRGGGFIVDRFRVAIAALAARIVSGPRVEVCRAVAALRAAVYSLSLTGSMPSPVYTTVLDATASIQGVLGC